MAKAMPAISISVGAVLRSQRLGDCVFRMIQASWIPRGKSDSDFWTTWLSHQRVGLRGCGVDAGKAVLIGCQ